MQTSKHHFSEQTCIFCFREGEFLFNQNGWRSIRLKQGENGWIGPPTTGLEIGPSKVLVNKENILPIGFMGLINLATCSFNLYDKCRYIFQSQWIYYGLSKIECKTQWPGLHIHNYRQNLNQPRKQHKQAAPNQHPVVGFVKPWRAKCSKNQQFFPMCWIRND